MGMRCDNGDILVFPQTARGLDSRGFAEGALSGLGAGKTRLTQPTGSLQCCLPEHNGGRYYSAVIKSYRDRDTESVAGGRFSRRLPRDIQRRAKMRLDRLNAAVALEDLRLPPSHRLEALAGDRSGQHSIRVNDQWRVCFVWREGHAWDVEIADYH